MPSIDEIKLSNKILRILMNNKKNSAIEKISNIEIKKNTCIGNKKAQRIVERYNKKPLR